MSLKNFLQFLFGSLFLAMSCLSYILRHWVATVCRNRNG